MKKRFCAMVLCVVVLLSALPVLAVSASLENFAPIRAYDGRFTDVARESWYYDNIAVLYAMGLTEGQTDSLFGVSSSITIGEALSFAARVRSAFYLGDPEAGAQGYTGGGAWYEPYIRYLAASGVGAASEFAGQYD